MLTAQESQLLSEIGFAPEIGNIIKTHTSAQLERCVGTDEVDENFDVDGLTFPIDRTQLEATHKALRAELRPLSYDAFWSKRRRQSGLRDGEEIVVLRTDDDMEIVRVAGSNGTNCDVMHDDVLARLHDWRKRCDFQIIGAASDWVAVEFQTLPSEICAFAEEIYEFCPDSVEQGVGLMHEENDPQLFAEARALWPQLSPKIKEDEDEKLAHFRATAPAAFQQMMDIVQESDNTSTEMGVKLLARVFQRDKYLFLWWD